MRAYIVLLALTVFVVADSARENKPKDVANGAKKGIEFVDKFFEEDPIGQQIAQLAKDWNETAPEEKAKIRTSLVYYCKGLKNETA